MTEYSDYIIVDSKRYKVQQLDVHMALSDDEVAQAVGARVSGAPNPFVGRMARALAQKMLERPGALMFEQSHDPAMMYQRLRVSVKVLVEE